MFFFVRVCACGHFVNDRHISMQNLIAFLRTTLKEIQPQDVSQKDQSKKEGKQHKKTT